MISTVKEKKLDKRYYTDQTSYTIPELVKLLGKSYSEVYNYISTKQLKSYQPDGKNGRIMIHLEDLKAFLRSTPSVSSNFCTDVILNKSVPVLEEPTELKVAKLLTIKKICQEYGFSVAVIRSYISKGKLKSYKVGGHRMVREDDLMTFLDWYTTQENGKTVEAKKEEVVKPVQKLHQPYQPKMNPARKLATAVRDEYDTIFAHKEFKSSDEIDKELQKIDLFIQYNELYIKRMEMQKEMFKIWEKIEKM